MPLQKVATGKELRAESGSRHKSIRSSGVSQQVTSSGRPGNTATPASSKMRCAGIRGIPESDCCGGGACRQKQTSARAACPASATLLTTSRCVLSLRSTVWELLLMEAKAEAQQF